MSFCHKIHLFGRHVVDRNKAGHEFVIAINHSKIFLMLAHGINQHFIRHFQKCGIKSACHRNRIFYQIIYNINQFFIRQHFSAPSGRHNRNLRFNDFFPLIRICNHISFAQFGNVIFRR